MLCPGTDPETYITEYTFVSEDKQRASKRFSVAQPPKVRYLIRRSPPSVPTALPTVGPMDDSFPGCLRNLTVVRFVMQACSRCLEFWALESLSE